MMIFEVLKKYKETVNIYLISEIQLFPNKKILNLLHLLILLIAIKLKC